MSVTAMSRTFWTDFPPLSYTDKNGKQITIKDTTAKIVLLAIADNADDFGENSYQSFETLATKASVDRRSVMRVVRALVANDFLKVAGISVYGTNNYSIALDKLGSPPAKRAKTGRPKSGDSEAFTSDPEVRLGDSGTESGDPEVKSGDDASPESSLIPPSNTPSNHPVNANGAFPEMPLEWKLLHNQEVTEQDLDASKAKDEAPKMFEKAFGFGSLPWRSNRIWEKFEKFVITVYIQDRFAFGNYVIWRADGSKGGGKYTAMSNKQIRLNPQIFMDTGWPDFTNGKGAPQSTGNNKYVSGDYADYIEH